MTVSAHLDQIPESMRPVYAAPRSIDAHHVMRFMAARGTRVIVVLGGLKPIGIVTARDLADRVPGGGLSETRTRVESAMSSPLMKIGEWGTVVDALAMMNQKGISHLPIVSANGSLRSLITFDEAQHLRDRGVTALGEFVRTSVIVSMVRRSPWDRMLHATRQRMRENRLWWLLAVGFALAGAAAALWGGRFLVEMETYQLKDYEPKDTSRQQYQEQKEKAEPKETAPRVR